MVPQLVKLLRDPSLAVQRSSYELVDKIAAKYVSDLVVEVELETENAPPVIELPAELVTLLSDQLAPTILDTPEDYSRVRLRHFALLYEYTDPFNISGLDFPAGLVDRVPVLRERRESAPPGLRL